jgi:hypothetical protein
LPAFLETLPKVLNNHSKALPAPPKPIEEKSVKNSVPEDPEAFNVSIIAHWIPTDRDTMTSGLNFGFCLALSKRVCHKYSPTD